MGHVPDAYEGLRQTYLLCRWKTAVAVVNGPSLGRSLERARKMQRPVATAMSQEAILEKVRSIVVEQLSVDSGEVKPERFQMIWALIRWTPWNS